jgi:hypothetical protein
MQHPNSFGTQIATVSVSDSPRFEVERFYTKTSNFPVKSSTGIDVPTKVHTGFKQYSRKGKFGRP